MDDSESYEDSERLEAPVTLENGSGRSASGRQNQNQTLAGIKRRRSLLTTSSDGSGVRGGGTGEDDTMSNSSSDRPQSTSDSREEGLSSNNSSEENERNLPIARLRSSSKKKDAKSASTSTKSATTTSSSSNSIPEGEFADPIGRFFDSGAAESTARKSSRLGGGFSGRGATSDLTSDDVSSSESAGKQHCSSDSDKHCSNDKELSTTLEKPSDLKLGTSRKEFAISSDFNFDKLSSRLDAPSESKESSDRRLSCNVSSGSDIDAIIRRAQNAGKSSASSSSSDDFSGQISKPSYGISNFLVDGTKTGIHEHKGLIGRRARTCQSSENESGSSNRSAVSSRGGSKDESMGGSFSTSNLDGIASVDNIGEGALSSSCSGGDNLNKLSDGGSSSDSDVVSIRENQVEKTQSVERMETGAVAASFLQDPLPQVSVTSSSMIPGNSAQLGSMSNQAFFVPPARPHQVLPVHLDYFLMKRKEAILLKSQESHQRLREWDAMMGLGSSHSITMTRSARSRKKLLNFTKKCLKKLTDTGIT